jgi:hypothetical protein
MTQDDCEAMLRAVLPPEAEPAAAPRKAGVAARKAPAKKSAPKKAAAQTVKARKASPRRRAAG